MQAALPWFFQTPSKGGDKHGCVVLFTLPFLMAGLGLFWSMSGRPVSDWMRAKSWEPADAVIEKAWIETTRNHDGDSRKVVVRYRYHYQGARHEGTRHSFVSTGTSLGVAMEDIVNSLKVGKRVVCWVNPQNPAEAVLDPSLPSQIVLGLFVCAPFTTVGIVGLVLLVLPLLRSFFSSADKRN